MWYFLISAAVPLVIVLRAPVVLNSAINDYFDHQPGTPTANDFADAILVILLAFSAMVALAGTAIRAIVHGVDGAGKSWDSAGKHLAVMAAVIATLAASVRLGLGPGAYVPWSIAGAAFVVAAVCTIAFFFLARAAAGAKKD